MKYYYSYEIVFNFSSKLLFVRSILRSFWWNTNKKLNDFVYLALKITYYCIKEVWTYNNIYQLLIYDLSRAIKSDKNYCLKKYFLTNIWTQVLHIYYYCNAQF